MIIKYSQCKQTGKLIEIEVWTARRESDLPCQHRLVHVMFISHTDEMEWCKKQEGPALLLKLHQMQMLISNINLIANIWFMNDLRWRCLNSHFNAGDTSPPPIYLKLPQSTASQSNSSVQLQDGFSSCYKNIYTQN